VLPIGPSESLELFPINLGNILSALDPTVFCCRQLNQRSFSSLIRVMQDNVLTVSIVRTISSSYDLLVGPSLRISLIRIEGAVALGNVLASDMLYDII
jgi:hypothetical protein